MSAASEFSFEALEPLIPARAVPAAAGGDVAPTPADELARARAEAERLRQAAREQGFQDGYAAGHAQALAEAASAALALAEAGDELRSQAVAAATRLERDAVELALQIADKVVAGALAVRPELVVEAVRHALRGVVERERVTVLVHPDDLPLVSGAMSSVQAELGGIEHWEVQAERRVSRGGAIVRHAHGDVDAQLESKFARAREVVETALEERG